MLYECHITLSVDYAEKATEVAKELHWKTSEIARDPVLGNATYFYLTTHTNDFPQMWERMKRATTLLEDMKVPVIREKIELIIHDTKA